MISDLQYAFYFYTDPATPSQCQPMTITWPSNVTLPVSLYGLIPGGTAFQVPIAQSPSETSVDWTANIAQGTDVILMMSDGSTVQTGGSTSLLEVGQGNTGCMNDTSPSASGAGTGTGTAANPGAPGVNGVGGTSGGGSGQGSNNQGNEDGGGGSKTPIGAIVGGTVGGVAFIVLLGILLFFCLKRRRRERRESHDSNLIKNYGMSSGTEKRNRFDILAGGKSNRDGGLGRSGSDAEARVAGQEYQPVPFRYPSPPPGSSTGTNTTPPTSFPGMPVSKEAESRRSHDSGNTTRTYDTPQHTASSVTGTGVGSQAGRTDEATIGHGVQRGASTRKTGGVPPSPNVSAPRRGVDDIAAAEGEGNGSSEEGMRFVQHKDEGPIVYVFFLIFYESLTSQ